MEIVRELPRTHFDDSLHLAVSMRSFRAENVSTFVKALLDCDEEWPSDCWYPARAIKAVAPKVPVIGLLRGGLGAVKAREFVDGYCTPHGESI